MATTKEQIAALELGKAFVVNEASDPVTYIRTKGTYHDGFTVVFHDGVSESYGLDEMDTESYTITVLN